MIKCDFCTDSQLINGRLVCPFRCCLMTQSKIDKILDKLGGERDGISKQRPRRR